MESSNGMSSPKISPLWRKGSYFLRMNNLCILSKYSLRAFVFAKAPVHKRAVAAFRTRNLLSHALQCAPSQNAARALPATLLNL